MTCQTPTKTQEAFELESRVSSGMQVRLLWVREHNEVFVEQIKKEGTVLRQVPAGEALTVFHHPETFEELRLSYDYRIANKSN